MILFRNHSKNELSKFDFLFELNFITIFKFLEKNKGIKILVSDTEYYGDLISIFNKNNIKFQILENNDSYTCLLMNNNVQYCIINDIHSIKNFLAKLETQFIDDFNITELILNSYNEVTSIMNNKIIKFSPFIKKISPNYSSYSLYNFHYSFYLEKIFTTNGNLLDIPPNLKYKINKIKIWTEYKNNMEYILNVQILNKIIHPNIDEVNFYCFNNVYTIEFSDIGLRDMINRIKICNLNSCYQVPKKYLSFIKSQEKKYASRVD